MPRTGWYGVPSGLMFCFPVMLNIPGLWTVVEDLPLTNEIEKTLGEMIKVCVFPQLTVIGSIVSVQLLAIHTTHKQ